jgi:hypothetical protein
MRHDERRIVGSWRSSTANGQRAEAQAGFRERAIAPHEIRICAGIDDVTERRSGQFLDGAEEVGGRVLRAGIHDDDSIRPDLNADVTHWRRDQIEVLADLKDLEARSFLLAKEAGIRRADRQTGNRADDPRPQLHRADYGQFVANSKTQKITADAR